MSTVTASHGLALINLRIKGHYQNMGLIFCVLLTIAPTQTPLVYKRFTPPHKISKKDLGKIVSYLPKAQVRIAKGFSSYSPVLSSPPFWFTDEGNIYYYKYIRKSKYKLQSLLKGSRTHSFLKISPISIPQVGVLPDNTVVVVRDYTVYYYSPSGHLLRKRVAPLSSLIKGFHSIGNGDLLIWDNTNILYMKKSGALKWKAPTSKPIVSLRSYGISNYFITELSNKKIESRSWKTGKPAWSKRIGAGLFGFVTGGDVILCTDLKNIKLIDPAKGNIKKTFKMPWDIKVIYFSSTTRGLFVYMEGYRIGYFDFVTAKFNWMAELGSPLGPRSSKMKESLVVTWNGRLLALAPKGKIVWSLPIPGSDKDKFKFFKIPGGNIGMAARNKVYFIYPPKSKPYNSKGSTK